MSVKVARCTAARARARWRTAARPRLERVRAEARGGKSSQPVLAPRNTTEEPGPVRSHRPASHE